MGTIIFIAITTIVLTWFLFKAFDQGDKYYELLIPFSILSLLVSMLLSLLLMKILNEIDSSKQPKGWQITKIASLSTHDQVSGRFTLGSGTVDSEVYYYYYVNTVDGGYRLDKIKADDVTLYEDDVTPCIRQRMYVRSSKFFIFMLGRCDIGDKKELHLPAGSIIKEFNPNY